MTTTTTEHPIRKYRREHNISAKDLAAALGVAESTLVSYENGWRKYPWQFALAFERLTGVSRAELLPELFK